MPASEKQIKANKLNAQRSTGPKTEAGKAVSRANSYKHGLTGSGAVLPELEEAEVQRRAEAIGQDHPPTSEIGVALIRHVARMSVRMERCGMHENALMTERVRKALADYDVPEGTSEAEIARLRREVTNRVLFDDSKEAILARKYAAAAERSFFRAIKELRLLAKEAKAANEASGDATMASILAGGPPDPVFEKMYANSTNKSRRQPVERDELDDFANLKSRVDVPISVGKRR